MSTIENAAFAITHAPDGHALTRTEKQVFTALARHYNETHGYAWPNHATIAAEAMLAPDTVSRVIRTCLVPRGLIEARPAHRRDGSRTSNRYFFPSLTTRSEDREAPIVGSPPPDRRIATPRSCDRGMTRTDPYIPSSSSARTRATADDHDDGEGADLDRAITAYKQHAGTKPHGTMRNEMAQLVHAGVAGAWFEEAWAAAEAQGAVRWAYVRAVLEHWRDHGRDCECRRRGAAAPAAEEAWDGTWTDEELVRLAQQ